MHTDGWHGCSCFGPVDVINKDHSLALMRGALTASGNARPASDAPLRIDEHCFFHGWFSFCCRPRTTSLMLVPFRPFPSIGSSLEWIFSMRAAQALYSGIFDVGSSLG